MSEVSNGNPGTTGNAGNTGSTANTAKTESTAVQVKILDKEYQVSCPPADQEALIKSARYLDENMRKIKGRGNIHGIEKIAVMAALNITHDMLRKNRLINETRHVTSKNVLRLEEKIDSALASARQMKIQ